MDEAKKRFPNVPTFLYGHSQGGNFALNLLLRKKPEVDGVIITAPWIKLATEPPKALLAIGKFLNNIFQPFLQMQKLVNFLVIQKLAKNTKQIH